MYGWCVMSMSKIDDFEEAVKGNSEDRADARRFKEALRLAEQIKRLLDDTGAAVPHDAIMAFNSFYLSLKEDTKVMNRYAASSTF